MERTYKPNEKSAQGVTGYLIRLLDGELYFRVYAPDRSSFKDYKINHHDLQVQITDDYSSFYDDKNEDADGYIDYPSRLCQKGKDVLRKIEGDKESGEKQADCEQPAPVAATAGTAAASDGTKT